MLYVAVTYLNIENNNVTYLDIIGMYVVLKKFNPLFEYMVYEHLKN